MIDVGGPAMLRAAAKNFAHVASVSRPDRYGFVLDELRARRASSRPRRAASSPPRRFATRPRTRRPSPAGSASARPSGDAACRRSRKVSRARVRREPAPARRVLRGEGRSPPPALARRAAARQGPLLQQPQRPLGRAARDPRSTAPRLRDRQAREPVRRRDRVHARGGVRARARRRSRLRVRRRRRPEPRGERGARRADRAAVRRGAVRAGLRRRRSRRSAPSRARAILDDRERRPRQPHRARPEARPRRPARPGPRLGGRRTATAWRSSAAAQRDRLGRPPVRLARVPARDLERNRDREGAADDRGRRRPDEPASTRSGSPSTRPASSATAGTAPCSHPTRSSRSPTGRELALRAAGLDDRRHAGLERESRPVRRMEARTRRMRGRRRPWRWPSSRRRLVEAAPAILGTELTRLMAAPTPIVCNSLAITIAFEDTWRHTRHANSRSPHTASLGLPQTISMPSRSTCASSRGPRGHGHMSRPPRTRFRSRSVRLPPRRSRSIEYRACASFGAQHLERRVLVARREQHLDELLRDPLARARRSHGRLRTTTPPYAELGSTRALARTPPRASPRPRRRTGSRA